MVRDMTMAVDRVPAVQVACRRRDVLNKLQDALKGMEEPPYEMPIPKAMLRGEKCECLRPPEIGKISYSPTSTLDGVDAIPFKIIDAQTKFKWTPKYPPECQNLHPQMSCYCAPQVFNPDLCDCPEGDRYKGQYRTKTPNVWGSDADYCTNGREAYYCPPDSGHRHWSPHVGTCIHPKPCKAHCFDHSDKKDWVNNVPPYEFYLQKDTQWD